MTKIGLIREGKVPTDKRVPLTPRHCVEVMEHFPNIEVVVQPSKTRIYLDAEYKALGIKLQENLSDCDILMGVKEVPVPDLIPGKTYFFFSHTIKKQPHNRRILSTVLEKKITLIDYECLKDPTGNRLVAFGYFAGVVGAYNTIKTYGYRYRLFDLKPAWQCYDFAELRNQFKEVKLKPVKIAVTGGGRVAGGAVETLEGMGVQRVTPEMFLNKQFNHPVFVQLHSRDYHLPGEGAEWSQELFYQHPEKFQGDFHRFVRKTDVLIAGAYWDPRSPVLFTRKEMRMSDFKIRVIGDITCDILGSIPSTIKSTSIEHPVYDYNPFTEDEEVPFSSEKNITVMSVDNLPCELSRDASVDFGNQLFRHVIPLIAEGNHEYVLHNATIATNGQLGPNFLFLRDFIAGDH